jgi:hypothetical protein
VFVVPSRAAEAEPWTDRSFHAPVVLLYGIVQALDLPQPGKTPQLGVFFIAAIAFG